MLAGGGPLRDEIAQTVVAAGLQEQFHLLGMVEDPELLLSELAVLVQPSDTETTSRVVLEAMSFRRRSTDRGSIRSPQVSTAAGRRVETPDEVEALRVLRS